MSSVACCLCFVSRSADEPKPGSSAVRETPTFGLLAKHQLPGSLRPMNRVTAELIAIAIVILLCAITLGWAIFGRRG